MKQRQWAGKIHQDKAPTGCNVAGRSVRPDWQIYDEDRKIAFLLDVTCPSEGSTEAFLAARLRKQDHYEPEARALEAEGYTVYLDAIVVGSLGTWDKIGFLKRLVSLNATFA